MILIVMIMLALTKFPLLQILYFFPQLSVEDTSMLKAKTITVIWAVVVAIVAVTNDLNPTAQIWAQTSTTTTTARHTGHLKRGSRAK